MKTVAALLLALLAAGQKNDQAEVQLKAAMHKELVDGDLKGAIEQYQKILASFGSNRAVGAKALVQMGQCYERLGKTEARTAYERVLREFAEQAEPARLARERLAALEQPAGRPEMAVRRAWTSQSSHLGRPSPDGRYLPYYDAGSGDLAIHDFSTGQSRRLYVKKGGWATNEEALDPVASPNGKQVAYRWRSNDNLYDLRVVGVDGSGARVLYSNQEELEYPQPHAWSPDGAGVLAGFQRKDKTWQMVLVSVGDGSVHVLKALGRARPSKMDFSPDGRYIAYDFPPRETSRQRDILALEIETGRETPLVQHAADDALMGWAPDGKSILFRSNRTGTRDAWLIQVSDGKPQGLPELVKKDIGDIVPLGFTRAGAYYYEVPRTTREIYTATLDLGSGKVLSRLEPAARRFVGWNMAPDWSPDGRFLAYKSRRGVAEREQVIVIQSAETGEERELKPKLKDMTMLFSLRWSPDGRSLLVDERDNDGKWGLIQVDAQTGGVTPLVQFPYGDMPGFGYGRDGKTVFYTVFDAQKQHHALTVRDLRTGRETVVVRRDVRYPALSPDGRWMAFSSYEAGSLVLTVMPAGGGPPRELYRYKAYGPRGVAWTPDGRQLLFAFLRDQKGELWRVPVEGGQPQRLDVVVDGLRQFRLHPDGRQAAFETLESKSEVWVMENFLPQRQAKDSGMAVRRILGGGDGLDGSLSPDDSYFSFTDWNTGNLALRELITGKQRLLTKDGVWSSPAEYTLYSKPSPDGKQVAYHWDAKGHPELRLIGMDGSGQRVLYKAEMLSDIVPFGWSPDGGYVLVTLTLKKDNACQIALVPVKDGSVRVLKTIDNRIQPIERMSFSPDGRYIAYDLRMLTDPPQRDIFVLAADGSRDVPLIQHPADDWLLDWTPDGKWILFASDRTGTGDAWVIPVAEGKAQGAPVLVRKDMGRIRPQGFARNGAYYYTLHIGGPDVYVASVDLVTGRVLVPPASISQRFEGSNLAPDWSPDGKHLLYISQRGPIGPGFNIPAIRSVETGRERHLSPKLNFLNQARWSPDGRSILAVCYDRTERRGICRIDAQTSEVTLLVENKPGENRLVPKGCPDGKSITYYYVAQGGKLRSIRMHNLETGEEKDIVGGVAWRFELSPDGRQLAFQPQDQTTKEQVLKVMPLAGGEPRELFRSKQQDAGLSWTPDGRRVLLEGSGSLWLIPVDGGKPQKIDLAMKGVRGPRVHPDGRRLAFWAEDPDWRNELWVMENFLPPLKAAR